MKFILLMRFGVSIGLGKLNPKGFNLEFGSGGRWVDGARF
ncbi:hypothetical protein LINPERPRIM_LOCUS30366 [Linum perenne]